MGAVYLAEHDRIGRRDAIKILNRDLADDEAARARFTREARNASFINHPNVCTVYDFGETREGLPFIAMEYVEGETLTGILDREGPLRPSRATRVIAQVTHALEAAHARDIVHRDLKPDNVMLARDARGSEVVKVVDFGIAKAMAAEEDHRQDITRQGLVVGTPQYVSPEQLEGKDLDGRSDLYSLGVVLFRVLTGKIPFTGETWQEVMTKRLSEEPMTLAEAAPSRSFPAELQQVIARALRRRPEDRYQDAAAFREDLLRSVEADGDDAVAAGAAAGPEGARAGTGHTGDRADGEGSGEPPDTEVAGAPGGADGEAAGFPDLPWRTIALGVAAIVGLVFAGAQVFAGGNKAEEGGDGPGSAVAVADSVGIGDDTMGVDGTGNGTDAGGTGADVGSGTTGGRDGATDPEPVDDDAQATNGDDAGTGLGTFSPDEVEAALKRQFDALGSDSLGIVRLRAIGDTGRAVWSMDRLSAERRAWAAHIAGRAQLALGDSMEACPWLERATDLDPEGRGYQALIDAVQACDGDGS